MNDFLSLGIAAADITPQKPVPLSGFGFRKGNFESIRSPLKLRCFLFRYPHEDVVIFSADLLCWGRDTTANCKALLEKNYTDAGRSRFLFLATHTHCGPSVSFYFSSEIGGPDRDYIAMLEQKVLETLKGAAENIRPVTARLYAGKTAIPINRRLKTNQGWIMAPNAAGPMNDDIKLIEFRVASGGIAAVWACASCHPTASGDNRMDQEFFVRGLNYYLEEQAPGAAGAFIQGCCGDVRPALIRDGVFFRGSLDTDSEELARRFTAELKLARSGPETELDFNTKNVFSQTVAELPFNPDFPHSNRNALAAGNDAIGEWARHFGDTPPPPYMPLDLCLFNLSRQFAMIFLSGEIVSEYSLYCKEISKDRVWAGGYAGGMTTYIPTAAQLDEGGYEPYESMFYLLQPAPFMKSAEKILKKKIRCLVM